MSKSVSVPYNFRGSDVHIPVVYNMEALANILTITCSVDIKSAPQWLQMRKFDITSRQEGKVYIPLFNALNNEKNTDTVLFIDQVYTDIMRMEKLVVELYTEDLV